jgi:HNH endonuclease
MTMNEPLLTEAEILSFFNTFKSNPDDRGPPNKYKKQAFHQGWTDAADRYDVYKEQALTRLTWQNVGNRFGSKFGRRSAEQIDSVYDQLAGMFEIRRPDGLEVLPGEILQTAGLREGSVCQVTVNAYERNPAARQKCLDGHGYRCDVCKISLGEEYGPDAERLIHVHHLRPIAAAGGEYEIDPLNDLRPVCPNCHAVIHKKKDPPYTIAEVQVMRRRAKGLE